MKILYCQIWSQELWDGLLVLSRAREIESGTERLADEALALEGSVAGTVLVASNPWIISHVLMPSLPMLAATYPRLRVHGIACSRARSLSRREVDLALWFEMPANDADFSVAIGDVPYAVYARRELDPDALEWLAFWDGEAERETMRWVRREVSGGELPRITATDALSVRAAIAAGLGKGLIPMVLGEEDPVLACLTPAPPVLMRALHAQIHPDMTQSVRLQHVLDAVRGQLRSFAR